MNRRLRRAEVSKGLIITLAVLVLAAGIFWVVRYTGSRSELKQAQPKVTAYSVTCSECGTLPDKISDADAKKMNADKQNGTLKCPKCGKYTAKWGRGGSGVINTEEEGEKP